MFRLQRIVYVATRRPCRRVVTTRFAAFSDNITYSGGQATEGQGGFYGSGGARALEDDTVKGTETTQDSRPAMLALAADVQKIGIIMSELDTLESLLEHESDATSSRAIELKAGIKKLMTSSDVLDSLNRLEAEGEPVWGLSSDEREMIILAREKVNAC